MEPFSESKLTVMQTKEAFRASGHPWVQSADIKADVNVEPASGVELYDAQGNCLGCGIYDPRDSRGCWRRYSFAEGVSFDEIYLASAIHEALSRRGEEGCQRLIHSDADYLPGLIVEEYDQVLTLTAETAAIDAQLPLIAEILKEARQPQEIVFLNHIQEREVFGLSQMITTLSGNNLKGRWVDIDGVSYRIDWLHPEKPRVYLDQREQHLLVGSLCEGRCVLDAHAHSGAFALHALSAGAEYAVAIDSADRCVKAIGAHAQRNDCFVEAIHTDASTFIAEREIGAFDVIVLDPPESQFANMEGLQGLQEAAFRCLPSGGILATYARSPKVNLEDFERMIARAAASSGREGRIFARTGQPFDFPSLLNLPEGSYLKGLILQVE